MDKKLWISFFDNVVRQILYNAALGCSHKNLALNLRGVIVTMSLNRICQGWFYFKKIVVLKIVAPR